MSSLSLVGALALVGMAASVGCSGSGSEGDACAAQGECGDALFCKGPDEAQVCGIPPKRGCSSDTDCVTGDRCHAIVDICGGDAQQGSECDSPCTAASCEAGFRCGSGGACEAIPCSEGAGCGALEACDANFASGTPVYAVTNGCQPIECATDASCPASGQCVNGRCQSGSGSCRDDSPVP